MWSNYNMSCITKTLTNKSYFAADNPNFTSQKMDITKRLIINIFLYCFLYTAGIIQVFSPSQRNFIGFSIYQISGQLEYNHASFRIK